MIANLGIVFNQGYKDCMEMELEDFLTLHEMAMKANKERE